MSLLSLVPFDDQAVTESESGTSICSTVKRCQPCPARFSKSNQNSLFIAVEERSRQGRLDVLDSLCREFVAGLELLRRLLFV
jgi:hypothetical protein